jgi:hypothetical protein
VGCRAELIADSGEAAETDDFFRSRPFYDVEGVTHTLRIEADGGEVLLPLLVREIPAGEGADATSPYGYPGAALSGEIAAIDPQAVDWSATGLVSVFARERLGQDPVLAGATRRSVVQVHDPSLPRRLRSRFREQIRRNRRLGYGVEVIAGPESSVDQRAGFHAAYTETMQRAHAAERYFFTPEYLAGALAYERSWLLLAKNPRGNANAGAIAALSDGMLHYFLGGTAEAGLADSPFRNVVDAMVDLADELGAPLNLGGGVTPGDGLEAFKRGFANAEVPFHTHEIVCDAGLYARLSQGREDSGFFPIYRAP